MLLTSVIIVLREFLEAALIIGVLFALGESMPLERRWAGWALGLGLLGALAYAGNAATVSDWLEGVGQEVVNALAQVAIYTCLLLTTLLIGRCRGRNVPNRKLLISLMTASVALAIAREGSEILIYMSGFAGDWDRFGPILIGGLVGAGIGTSVGALTYYVLINANRNWSPYVGTAVIVFVAAGMLSQAVSLLIQADWLPSQLPLWDTSGWISERSLTGQLLYALLGYEATPTPIQVAAHIGGLLLPIPVLLIFRQESNRDG